MLSMLALLLSAPSPALHKAAERAREAVITACHIPAERLAIEQDEGSTLYSVALKGSDPLSDRQIACFGATIGPRSDKVAFSIEDARLGVRYDRLAERASLRSARAILRRQGLLKRLPVFDRRRETLAAFALRLEQLCGAAPRTVLRARGGYLSLRSGVLHGRARRADREFCIINAGIAAGHNPLYVPLVAPIPFDPPPLPMPTAPLPGEKQP
jgi:hypothetical protein